MIVDCHTHVWQTADQLGRIELGDTTPVLRSPGKTQQPAKRVVPNADPLEALNAEDSAVDKAIVLGFRSKYLEASVPNDYIAKYVSQDPERLIGFAGIDPTEESALEDLIIAHEQLKMRGVSVSPGGQDFHPTDTRAMRLYEQAAILKMPVVFHSGGLMTGQSKLEYSRPFLLDEIARSFPSLPIVVAQMGQPWIDETIVLIGKHANVYADVSGLLIRPWPAYNALVSAYQYGVMEKLLFGSDYPYTKPSDCINALYCINQLAQGTNFPVIPREALRGIVERDTLELLGLE
jgi:uncharacterized protein